MVFELTEKLSPGNLLIPYFKDEIETDAWSKDMDPSMLSGKAKEVHSLWSGPGQRQLHFLGLGEKGEYSEIGEVFQNYFQNHRKGDLVIDLRHLGTEVIFPCVYGSALSSYQIGLYKTDVKDPESSGQVTLLVNKSTPELQGIIDEAQYSADTVKGIMTLVDAPANIKTPQYLAEWALNSGSKYGFKVEVLKKDDLEQQGFHSLLAVGQGSINSPLLIKMEYRSNADKGYHLGLAGKGVTFDTGGISIKKSTNMHYMKSDMGGAAAVMGTLELIARLQLPINVIAVVPAAENAVDALSIRPGDVISSYSQKSIEIIDTDAEGRLILADALSYLHQQYNPQHVIDMATLTGSCVAALGFHAAGIFTNNELLFESLQECGNRTNEKVWRLPLWEVYEEDLFSDLADVRNFSGKPVAGAITAAKFLEFFIKDHPSWAHLDIAGVAFGKTDHAKLKSATGYGVRLLTEYAKSLINSSN